VGRTEWRRSVDEPTRSVHAEVYVPSRVAPQPPSIRIRTDELRTVREAMRDFGSLIEELEAGEVDKLVLTQRNRMRAVVVSVERWSEVEQALGGARRASAVRATGSGSER
jgi:PHD/YefM family antitoxin component YafN of YafNO toxin-antitoxin module